MTTTIELPDSVYSQIQAHAAQQGMTVDAFLLDVINEKLAEADLILGRPCSASLSDRIHASLSDRIHEALAEAELPGWRSVFGKGDKEAVADVQRIIDEKFSKINPEDWK